MLRLRASTRSKVEIQAGGEYFWVIGLASLGINSQLLSVGCPGAGIFLGTFGQMDRQVISKRCVAPRIWIRASSASAS